MSPQSLASSNDSYHSQYSAVTVKLKKKPEKKIKDLARTGQPTRVPEERQDSKNEKRRDVSELRQGALKIHQNKKRSSVQGNGKKIEDAGVIDFGFVNAKRGLLFSPNKMRHDWKYVEHTFKSAIFQPLKDDVTKILGIQRTKDRKGTKNTRQKRKKKKGFWSRE